MTTPSVDYYVLEKCITDSRTKKIWKNMTDVSDEENKY